MVDQSAAWGTHPPQRTLDPDFAGSGAARRVLSPLAASCPPKSSTAPVLVRTSPATAPGFALQAKVAPSGSTRVASPKARPFPRSRPLASSIQRVEEDDDDFEVPEEYRPRPLPTLWDWIQGPLHEAEYPTHVATVTDVPVPVVHQAVLVQGPVPQHGVLVRAPVSIEDLLKKGHTPELSLALKEKYGDKLGGEMSRQMRIKATTSEQSLKQRAEEKVGKRENQSVDDGKTTSLSSGGLNQKGKTVSNLTRRTGQGFAAGEDARWHVRYDHVGNERRDTRINFTARAKQTILSDFTGLRPQPATVNRQSWDVCEQWMVANL
jgi:hypothetical protein